MLAGTLLYLVGAFSISWVNNNNGITTLIALSAIELCVAGGVVLAIGYAGLVRNLTQGYLREAQVSGLLLGAAMLGGGLSWEAVEQLTSVLTVYALTVIVFAGLTILCLALSSLMAPRPSYAVASPPDVASSPDHGP